jgi:hypothetical protein
MEQYFSKRVRGFSSFYSAEGYDYLFKSSITLIFLALMLEKTILL